MRSRTITLAAALALLVAGCALAPNAVQVAAVHQSQPFRGMGPPPVGDHSASQETNWEAVEGTLTWDLGSGWQAQSSMAYVVHSNNLTAPDGFLFGCRVGREVRLTW